MMHNVGSASCPDGMEVVSSSVLVVMAWHSVVEMTWPSVVSIDAEPPSVVGKYDWTIVIIVGGVERPL